MEVRLSLPWGQGLHAAQLLLTFPWGQALQSTQLRFSLPCGQGLHSAQLRFSFPWGHRFTPMARHSSLLPANLHGSSHVRANRAEGCGGRSSDLTMHVRK